MSLEKQDLNASTEAHLSEHDSAAKMMSVLKHRMIVFSKDIIENS